MRHSLYSTCLLSLSSPLSSLRSSFSHFIQTLTQLNLSRNGISDAGAHHLAEALRDSKVSETLLVLHLSFLSLFSSISRIRSSFSHFIQTLTQLNLPHNEISDAGAQHLANALRNSKVSETLLVLHLSFLYLFSSISPLRSSFSHFIQTLTQLNLSSNRISDGGAQHLADALRNSKVSETLLVLHLSFLYLFSSISLHSIIFLSFHPDTHSTGSFAERDLRCRCSPSGRCTTKQRGE